MEGSADGDPDLTWTFGDDVTKAYTLQFLPATGEVAHAEQSPTYEVEPALVAMAMEASNRSTNSSAE